MKKYILSLILILTLTFTLTGNCDWLSDYDQRIKLTTDHTKIDTALSHFPVTVFFTSTHGEEIFAEFTENADFDRSCFTKADGTTSLYAECELFDFAGSKAIYHVSRYGWDISADADTIFYFYYDDTASHNLAYISGINGLTFQPLVTICIEDGYSCAYTDWKPLFDNQGEVACAAVITDGQGTGGHMTWAQTLELQAAGWEIQNHTKTHTDLTTLNEAQIRAEFEGSISDFAVHGITTNNLGYPFARNNALVKNLAREYFRAARNKPTGEGGQGVNPQVLEIHNLMIQEADATVINTLKARVDTAKAGNRWVIFYVHEYTVDKGAKFNELIDYIQAEGVDIVTMDQALDIFVDAGRETWNDDFKFVCHMVDDNGNVDDSTSNNNDGTKLGAGEPAEAEGKVGLGQDFDGADDDISFGYAIGADLSGASGITIEFVIKNDVMPSAGTIDYIFGSRIHIHVGGIELNLYDTNLLRVAGRSLYTEDIESKAIAYTSTGAWKHVVGILDFANDLIKIYVDGVEEINESVTFVNTTYTYDAPTQQDKIGRDPNPANTNCFNGIIDESHISNIVRSAEWIKGAYNSLWDSLLTYGSEELVVNTIWFGTNF